MAIRFRRSVKIAPGIRLNVGKRGISTSFGPRGASLTVGRQGVFANVGAPGTGFSYRTKLSGTAGQQAPRALPSPQQTTGVQVVLGEDGAVSLAMADGSETPEGLERVVKQQQGQAIQAWLAEQTKEINEAVESRVRIHLKTPSPEQQQFLPATFSVPLPRAPVETPIGLLGKILPSRRERIAKQNQEAAAEYQRKLKDWEHEKARFEEAERRRRLVFEELRFTDLDVMHEYLTNVLKSLAWPGETNVSFQLEDAGKTAYIDVDLPEIEDFPTRTARVATRGLRLIFKEISDTQTRKNYMQHVHGVGFRIAGVTFYSLPKVERVVLSAYSQRPDKKTGHDRDEYLYSVKLRRPEWLRISFDNLESVDVVEALAAFEIRRKMTKAGVFQPIEPFAPPS